MVMGQIVAVLVVVGADRAPRKVTIVAAVVERRCTGRRGHDGQISLMLGPNC